MSEQKKRSSNDHVPSVLKILELHSNESILTLKDLEFLLSQEERTRDVLLAKKDEQRNVTRTNIKKSNSELEEEVASIMLKFVGLRNKINKTSKSKLPSKIDNPSVYSNLDKISELEKTSLYITTCTYIRTVSDRINTTCKNGGDLDSIRLLNHLQLIQNGYLRNTECANLLNYCGQVSLHWEKKLETKFTHTFENLLSDMDWPKKLDILDKDSGKKERFRRSILCLLKVKKLSSSQTEDAQKPAFLVDFEEPITPIRIMLRPLKRRFRYHFFSEKATQNDNKPEWYFAQIKKWIRETIPFIKCYMEPLTLKEMGVSSMVDFVRSLSELLILKCDSQISGPTENVSDSVFAKILEESIYFENEVGRFVGEHFDDREVYIPPFVSTLFSQPHILERWLTIEKSGCYHKLDEIFRSLSAWDRAVVPGPPEIVDLFIAMLRFLTDRFAHLQQPGQRIRFFQLFLEILDDFRVRCLQTWKSSATVDIYLPQDVLIDYIIADSLLHIRHTLERWEDLPFFSSLSFFLRNLHVANESEAKSKCSAESDMSICDPLAVDNQPPAQQICEVQKPTLTENSLFSASQKLYQTSGEEILAKWCTHFVSIIRHDIERTYARKKWHSFEHDRSNDCRRISPEFLIPFQKLSTICKTVITSMNAALAETWLKRLAVHLDEMLMEVLIMPNKFSTGAMLQIHHDIVYGMFPVFKECDIKTSIFFNGLTCALRVWEMSQGDIILTLQTLTDPSVPFDNKEETLAELELSLRPSDAIKLLRTRADLII